MPLIQRRLHQEVLPFMMFLDNTESFTRTIGVEPGFTGAQYLIGIPRGQ